MREWSWTSGSPWKLGVRRLGRGPDDDLVGLAARRRHRARPAAVARHRTDHLRRGLDVTLMLAGRPRLGRADCSPAELAAAVAAMQSRAEHAAARR